MIIAGLIAHTRSLAYSSYNTFPYSLLRTSKFTGLGVYGFRASDLEIYSLRVWYIEKTNRV